MIRLLGAITGSALALAALLVLIGIPQFRTESIDFERPVVTLPYSTKPVEDVPPAALSVAATDGGDSQTIPAEVPAEAPQAASAEHLPAAPEETLQAAREWLAGGAIPVPVAEAEPDWYAFWSPFRSELAASGFIEQLQRVTGLDYRVVKLKTGVYEVAFAYDDDAKIDSYLSQITAATGLNMAEQ